MIKDSDLSISHACQNLRIGKSTYYAWQLRVPSSKLEGTLRQTMHNIAQEFPGYGYRRITAELHRQKVAVNHKKILRLMREERMHLPRVSLKRSK